MQTFTITPPNTCALVTTGSVIAFIGDQAVGAPIYVDDTATYVEYLTYDDAAAAAVAADPTYNLENIYGPLTYEVDTETGGGNYLYGDPVILEYVVSSPTVGTVVTYQWVDAGGLDIPGRTSSTLNLGGASVIVEGSYTCVATLTAPDGRTVTSTSDVFSVRAWPVVGEFTLTRSGNDITTGLFSFLQGAVDSTATIEVPAIPLTISYDPTDGFKTTGSPLLALDQVAELFINGEFVKSFTIHSVDGTFTYNFSS